MIPMTRPHAKLSLTIAALALLCSASAPALAQNTPAPAAEPAQSAGQKAVQQPEGTDASAKAEQNVDAAPKPPRIKPPTGKVFDARTMMLDNGMQVVVVENNRVPVITHMVWYRTGAADEPRGKSGIAHYLEHLMFKGSEGLEPGEFSRTIRNLGGNDNAFTSQDYTAYFQSIAAEHLETVMTMEAGRMRGLNPPEKEVLSERQVILEERKQRTDNNPQAQFSESMGAALYVNHPYGIPVIGWAHEMESLSWDDAKTFYDRWYAPNNAILVVSGDVTAEAVFDLAKKIYGPLEKVEVPERKRTVSPPLVGKKLLTYSHSSIRQPVYQRRFRAPGYRQNKDHALALQVLEDIFGSGPTSRLYKSLVIDQKLATSAGLNYSAASWGESSISLYATPAPGITMEQIEQAVEAEITKLVRDGVSEDELNDSLNRMQAEAIYARDSLTGPAMVIGYSLVTGSTLDDVEYWPQNIAKVSAAEVQAVAAKYLDASSPDARFVTGYLLPKTQEDK
ncbi:MAG: peptidase M16 [Micavibrio sp.]|nr:peptidase M16 [Micavibrio sp.]